MCVHVILTLAPRATRAKPPSPCASEEASNDIPLSISYSYYVAVETISLKDVRTRDLYTSAFKYTRTRYCKLNALWDATADV